MLLQIKSPEVQASFPALPKVAGITQGDRFASAHEITRERALRAISLAGAPAEQRHHPSAEGIAKAWLVMAGHSSDYAGFAGISGGEKIVIIRRFSISFRNSTIPHIDGLVGFNTLVTEVDPSKNRMSVITQASYRKEVVADTLAELVFSPTFVTQEERTRLDAIAQRLKNNSGKQNENGEQAILV